MADRKHPKRTQTVYTVRFVGTERGTKAFETFLKAMAAATVSNSFKWGGVDAVEVHGGGVDTIITRKNYEETTRTLFSDKPSKNLANNLSGVISS